MIKITIYPHFILAPGSKQNPYIHDFVAALDNSSETKVVNKACKSTLLSLLLPRNQGNVFIFNWFESIPDSKHWLLHTIIAICLVIWLRIRKKQIIWMLHNKESHATCRKGWKHFMTRFIAKYSTMIITHSKEGIELLKRKYPQAVKKAHFLHHPTKCRILPSAVNSRKQFDLLIWGNISRYKGVIEFLRFMKEQSVTDLKVCIVGKCASQEIQTEIKTLLSDNIYFRGEAIPFDELRPYIEQSEFVLIPYNPESVLSSGTLMDSLSFGAKIIGPDVGSFKDYKSEPLLNVYTFNSFKEIPDIVKTYKNVPASISNYQTFLKEHDWIHFSKELTNLITSQK